MADPEVVARGASHYGRDKHNELPTYRHNRREDDCTCQPWVYNPRCPAPINPNCPEHGPEPGAIFIAQEAS